MNQRFLISLALACVATALAYAGEFKFVRFWHAHDYATALLWSIPAFLSVPLYLAAGVGFFAE